MHWVTIYDIGNSRAVWHLAAVSLSVACFGAYVVPTVIGMVRSRTKRTTRPRVLPMTLLLGLALIAATGWLYTAWHGKWGYVLGRTLTAEGPVEEVRIAFTPHGGAAYVQVGKDWFRLPAGLPRACYPQDGETVRLVANETADPRQQGPSAHAIYRLSLTHACSVTPPASPVLPEPA